MQTIIKNALSTRAAKVIKAVLLVVVVLWLYDAISTVTKLISEL